MAMRAPCLRHGHKFIITEVMHIQLGTVARTYFKEEGFDCSADFVKFWLTIHPFEPYKLVHVHKFQRALLEARDGAGQGSKSV